MIIVAIVLIKNNESTRTITSFVIVIVLNFRQSLNSCWSALRKDAIDHRHQNNSKEKTTQQDE